MFAFHAILGDPGAVGGGRESLNGRKKNSGEEKKSPWGQGFNGPVPNGRSNCGF